MAPSVSVVILAAGNSSRMGCSKTLLKFDESKTFLEKIITTYLKLNIQKIVLVINNKIKEEVEETISKYLAEEKIILITNQSPEKGRFHSIKMGLRNINSDNCFIQNIDNPFISLNLLSNMIQMKNNCDYVVPVFQNKIGHPILINKKIQTTILSNIKTETNLRFVLLHFKKNEVQCSNKNILANINTMEEYYKNFHHARNFSEIN